ncbi:MAG: hypothetical protein GTO08_06885, partial [Deltaproteobacteria bacterium]|nr:hypothetical protein [Deltaproteobacteria bacterium]
MKVDHDEALDFLQEEKSMRFALCNELYGTYDIYTVIDRAAELGYHGIELAPFTLTQDVQGYPVEEQKKLA